MSTQDSADVHVHLTIPNPTGTRSLVASRSSSTEALYTRSRPQSPDYNPVPCPSFPIAAETKSYTPPPPSLSKPEPKPKPENEFETETSQIATDKGLQRILIHGMFRRNTAQKGSKNSSQTGQTKSAVRGLPVEEGVDVDDHDHEGLDEATLEAARVAKRLSRDGK